MKRKISLLVVSILFGTISFSANANIDNVGNYIVSYIKGTVLLDNKILAKDDSIKSSDVLLSDRESVVRLNKNKKIYTLRVNGENTVQTLIDKIPERYLNTINSLRENVKRTNRANIAYGPVTNSIEFDKIEFEENEAYVCCKEDSLGNLNVIFMRYGMETPMMYTINATSHIYLLQMAILTAQGYDFAYEHENSYIYEILWMPLEKYFQPGDIVYMVLPDSLSVFDMDEIPIDDEYKMVDLYEIYTIDVN